MSTFETAASTAATVRWDLSPLMNGLDDIDLAVDTSIAAAEALLPNVEAARGTIASMSESQFVDLMDSLAEFREHLELASELAFLSYATATDDPAAGARIARIQERGTEIANRIVFFELEWAQLDAERAEQLLAADGVASCRHFLQEARAWRPYQLSEPEEQLIAEKAVTGRAAFGRLFEEQSAAIELVLDGAPATLEQGLARLSSPDADQRAVAAAAITEGLAPGLRVRAYTFNLILADKAADDRRRGFPTWLSERNLENQTTDSSVSALIAAVRARYDLPQRWYAAKASMLGLERLNDYDRMATLPGAEGTPVTWDQACELVLDSYASFSEPMAKIAREFIEGKFIDAPPSASKMGGAFCAYAVPSKHPYVLVNFTGRRQDVFTLAHELGHGIHAAVSRPRGIFEMSTPLTLAETASVFGETVTFARLLDQTTDPHERLSLLSSHIEDTIATVFRQVAMNDFEDRIHRHRREIGELSLEDFADAWEGSQTAMLGPAVTITEGYRSWWSYVGHFVRAPGYVYAYAYGQLFALSIYRQYELRGAEFAPLLLEMLSAGGSKSPEALAAMVGIDLSDPAFWDGGLAIVEHHLDAAIEAAKQTGYLTESNQE